jgi:GNAT superfamily N-acetyltransferase
VTLATRRGGILAGYRGYLDTVEPALSGWVSEIASPHRPVTFLLSMRRDSTRSGRPITAFCSTHAAAIGVVGLTVLETYRRKGLGEALMRALLRAATEGRVREVWLSVRPDNPPALRLYEKLDFIRNPSHPAGRWAIPGEMTMVWLPRGERNPE